MPENTTFAGVSNDRPLIPEGTYDLVLHEQFTFKLYGKAPKIVLEFRIVSQGKSHGVILPCFYNATAIRGKPQRGGCFTVARGSNFLFDYFTLFPHLPRPTRLDRLPISPFKSVVIEGTVITVTHGNERRHLPPQMQYSKIDKLLRVKEL